MAVASGQMAIHSGEKDLVLGLDPGRDKTGFAIVSLNGDFIAAGIFPTVERDKFFDFDAENFSFSEWLTEGLSTKVGGFRFTFIGNGTGSEEFFAYVKNKVKDCEIILVDERNTTLEARRLYWKLHKPGIFTRLLPEGLRVPDRPLDDLAALALTLRGLRGLGGLQKENDAQFS